MFKCVVPGLTLQEAGLQLHLSRKGRRPNGKTLPQYNKSLTLITSKLASMSRRRCTFLRFQVAAIAEVRNTNYSVHCSLHCPLLPITDLRYCEVYTKYSRQTAHNFSLNFEFTSNPECQRYLLCLWATQTSLHSFFLCFFSFGSNGSDILCFQVSTIFFLQKYCLNDSNFCWCQHFLLLMIEISLKVG